FFDHCGHLTVGEWISQEAIFDSFGCHPARVLVVLDEFISNGDVEKLEDCTGVWYRRRISPNTLPFYSRKILQKLKTAGGFEGEVSDSIFLSGNDDFLDSMPQRSALERLIESGAIVRDGEPNNKDYLALNAGECQPPELPN